MFNNLQLHEDTAFFIQLSLNCVLEPGIIHEPVGLRGVHGHNRIVDNPKKSDSLIRMWAYLYNWSVESIKSKSIQNLFGAFFKKEKILYSSRVRGFFLLVWCSISNSSFIKQSIFFSTACEHVFGNYVAGYLIMIKERVQRKIFKSNPYDNSIVVNLKGGFKNDGS
jgi:hypothetical protein